MNNDIILAKQVTKRYKNGVQALTGLTLAVKHGEIFSLLGKNGAGKSTLIRILTTRLRPTSGSVALLGRGIHTDASWIRSRIACVSQRPSIDTFLSLEDNMMFQSRLYGIPKADAKRRMERLISAFHLEQYRACPVSSYSGGIKRRLDLALHITALPKILFLDEPTVSLDIESRLAVWNMLKRIRDDFGTTIFLTTHDLEEADALSDTICLIKNGKALVQGTPLHLRSLLRRRLIRIQFPTKEKAQACLPLMRQHFPASDAALSDMTILANAREGYDDMPSIAAFLLERHIPFSGIAVSQPSLEDVFMSLLTEGGEQPA